MVEVGDGEVEMKELDKVEVRRRLEDSEDLIVRSVEGVIGCYIRCSCDGVV